MQKNPPKKNKNISHGKRAPEELGIGKVIIISFHHRDAFLKAYEMTRGVLVV